MGDDYEEKYVTVVPESSPEESVRVPISIASQWEYFAALLSGRWGYSDEVIVPLSTQEILTWYSVATQTPYDFEFNYPLGESRANLVHYNLVAPVVDFFGPTNDDWLRYTLIDERVPEDKRRDLYVRQGRSLRDRFLSYDFSYVNYLTSSDPVYLRWDDEEEDKRQAWLNKDNYSILTSILHNGYLVSDVRLMATKPVVPWYNVNRKEIIKYVPQPNLFLSFELEKLYEVEEVRGSSIMPFEDYVFKYGDTIVYVDEQARQAWLAQLERRRERAPTFEDYMFKYGETLEQVRLTQLERRGEGVPTFEDYVLADMTPPESVKPVFRLPSLDFMRFSYQYPVKLSTQGDKTILTTQAPRVMELYEKVAIALLRHGSIYERVRNSGAYVLLKAYVPLSPEDDLSDCWPQYNDLLKLQDKYATTEQLVRAMTVQALSCGDMLHAHDTISGKYAVYKSEYKRVIKYFLETLGSVVLTEIAILLVELYGEMGSKDDRLLSFAELVRESLPEEPTRATKMP